MLGSRAGLLLRYMLRILSYAALQMCYVPLFCLFVRCAHYPYLWYGGKRGVWGEGAEGPGSPHNYTAKIDLWQRGP